MVIQDLAELVALQQEVRQTASLAEIGRMAAVVAHEIRNPLGGIEGFASLLQEDLGDSPEKKRYADFIVDGIQDLKRIVSSLLNLSKNPDLRYEEIDIQNLLRDCSELALQDSVAEDCKVQLNLDSQLSQHEILADPGALRQVFLNVIRNAIEAMADQATGDLRIRLAPAEVDPENKISIEVADTGPGLSPRDSRVALPTFCNHQS